MWEHKLSQFKGTICKFLLLPQQPALDIVGKQELTAALLSTTGDSSWRVAGKSNISCVCWFSNQSQSNKEYFCGVWFISKCAYWKLEVMGILILQYSSEKAGTARTFLPLIKYLKTSSDYSLNTIIALSMTNQPLLTYPSICNIFLSQGNNFLLFCKWYTAMKPKCALLKGMLLLCLQFLQQLMIFWYRVF